MSQSRILNSVATGASLTRRVADAIPLVRARGWQPAVVATSSADTWLDRDSLTQLDFPILGEHRTPGETKRFPRPDAVILASATFNTINKLASGIADTHALSVLCSALGTHTPIVIVPFVSTSLAGHPAWLASLAVLRYAGAVLIDPRHGSINAHVPLEPGTGETVTDAFRWEWALDQIPADDTDAAATS